MGRVAARLASHRTVGLDAPVFIYQYESHPSFAIAAGELFDLVARGRLTAITSVLTLAELLTGPLREGRRDVADAYELVTVSLPNLAIAPIDQRVAYRAAELRARYGLRLPDALHVATALLFGASVFVTNDRRLSRIRDLEVVILGDMLEDGLP